MRKVEQSPPLLTFKKIEFGTCIIEDFPQIFSNLKYLLTLRI